MSRKTNGFTLVELLVVMLILGILASIAVPKYSGTRDKAKLAAVRSDVRNVESAEESYFSDNGGYATMSQLLPTGYAVSPGTIMSITLVSGGYSVQATNTSIDSPVNGCRVQVGGGVPMSVDGVITCP